MRRLASLLARVAIGFLACVLTAHPVAAEEPVSLSPEAKIDPWVSQRLLDRGADSFLVLFDTSRSFRDALDRDTGSDARATYDRLRARAKDAQAATRRWLDARGIGYRKLYIVNGLEVEGDLELARQLAERIEVARIVGDPAVRGVEAWADGSDSVLTGIEWNVSAVKANTVWTQDGVRGEGIVVASADTGVEWSHPALKSAYLGWNGSTVSHDFHWHDAIADLADPIDDYGHGTHTVGTMVGDDGLGNQIGVAPKAKWIACRNMNIGVGQPSTYLDCIQFFLAPYPHGGDPEQDGDPTRAPNIINNSWTCPPSEGCDPDTLQDAFAALRSAGILAVAAAGNSGSACSTVDEPPGTYEEALSVGATTSATALVYFSSRGPVTVDGSGRIKPDLSAPGSSVRSSIRGGAYGIMSGTSMASPHVAGAAALLWSARPQFRGRIAMTRCLLTRGTNGNVSTTVGESCGGTDRTVRPNNLFGWGLLDASNAIHLGPDADGDGVGDACDCAPTTGGAFDVPVEVAGTVFAADHATLSWPSVAASAGTGTVYDVVRGDILDLRASGTIAAAGCVGGGLTSPSFLDAGSPATGHTFYYVVQARNFCGSGGWGFDSAGTARTHVSCP